MRRPCKAFMPTYHQLAERFSDFVMLEITGDETPELRQVMKEWKVRIQGGGGGEAAGLKGRGQCRNPGTFWNKSLVSRHWPFSCPLEQIKTTPTFRIYRNGEVIDTVSGTRDNKLLNALLTHIKDGEMGRDWTEVTHEEFPADP
jgi:thiol-disulfide isomerase/thioredoxin